MRVASKMRHLHATFAAALLLLLLLLAGACGSGGRSSPPAIPSAACMDPTANVVITDATNYTLSNDFTIQLARLKDNTDLLFDWSGVTRDFFGKSLDPAADIDIFLVSLWALTPDQIRDALRIDDLPLTSNSGVITTFPDGTYTSQHLLGFNELGNPLPADQVWSRFNTADPNFAYPQDQYTFLAMASTGTEVGKGPRMLAMFHIDPAATDTSLLMTNHSTKLSYSVDLLRGAPVQVPAGIPALTIDWSQMTTNAIGNPYNYYQITSAAVAHYPAKSVAELEPQFLSLEDIADGWWSGDVLSGSSISLGTLVDKNGAAFPGIDDNGVWMAALFCTNCNNPAPWSITVLQPCH
jgi:hypothetical protein